MKILVINCGSSSVKCKLFRVEGGKFRVLVAGLVERIGEEEASLHLRWPEGRIDLEPGIASHHEALEGLERELVKQNILPDFSSLGLIAHRVVHGGERFHQPVVVDNEVMAVIRSLAPLAPLHNPYNLEGITAMREKAPEVAQVAVFDTAFHQTMPETSYLYALPYELYQNNHVRRYGFHGISHGYLLKTAAGFLKKEPEEVNLISLHLGNGASAAAVRAGRCIDTSMGMTPMEGLVMGTRSGDLDPGILLYLERECGFSIADLDQLLNSRSGLLGVCGENDMREILTRLEQGDERAELACAIFCYRLKKYIGAYAAVLGRLDALVFSGGIGAKSAVIRERVCAGLDLLGIRLDPVRNRSVVGEVSGIDDNSGGVRVLAVETDEELEIARQGLALWSSPTSS